MNKNTIIAALLVGMFAVQGFSAGNMFLLIDGPKIEGGATQNGGASAWAGEIVGMVQISVAMYVYDIRDKETNAVYRTRPAHGGKQIGDQLVGQKRIKGHETEVEVLNWSTGGHR